MNEYFNKPAVLEDDAKYNYYFHLLFKNGPVAITAFSIFVVLYMVNHDLDFITKLTPFTLQIYSKVNYYLNPKNIIPFLTDKNLRVWLAELIEVNSLIQISFFTLMASFIIVNLWDEHEIEHIKKQEIAQRQRKNGMVWKVSKSEYDRVTKETTTREMSKLMRSAEYKKFMKKRVTSN